MSSINKLDTSTELCLERHGNGIKLVNPEDLRFKLNKHQSNMITLSQLFDTDFNIYLMDPNSTMVNNNEIHAARHGLLSPNDYNGKSIFDMGTPECAHRIRNNDLSVIQNFMPRVFEEEILSSLDSDYDFSCLSIKLPWLIDHKTIGVFGCTIVHEQHSVADSLTRLAQFGLLSYLESSHISNNLLSHKVKGIQLTKRQSEIVFHTVKGKTQKEISLILNLSIRTVEHHLEKIKDKLNVSTKSELIEKAYDEYL